MISKGDNDDHVPWKIIAILFTAMGVIGGCYLKLINNETIKDGKIAGKFLPAFCIRLMLSINIKLEL